MTSLATRNVRQSNTADPQISALLAHKPLRVPSVAMANHTARAI